MNRPLVLAALPFLACACAPAAGPPGCADGAAEDDGARVAARLVVTDAGTPAPDAPSPDAGALAAEDAAPCGGCAHLDSACRVGVCDAAVGACVAQPQPDGLDCDDGDPCLVGEACVAGECAGGAPVDCGATAGDCREAARCSPEGAEGNCDVAGAPVGEGAPCDDCAAGAGACGACAGGTCAAAACGDGVVSAGEACDDGNGEPLDGCARCLLPVGHLLISEVVVTPTAAELVEIHNPTGESVELSSVWLADLPTYYLVASGGEAKGTDFLLAFPAGATIAPGGFAVVSLHAAGEFAAAHGMLPDFDWGGDGVPAMAGSRGGAAGLTNGGEMIVLFRWEAGSARVTDLDYVVFGDAAEGMDKSGVTVGDESYAGETPTALQSPAPAPTGALHRCDPAEATETHGGGNGADGHDETSEDLAAAFVALPAATPGAPPPAGACP